MNKHNSFHSLALAAALLVSGAGNAAATFDAFLKITGVNGESQDANHSGESVVLSFEQSTTAPSSGGNPTFTFSVVKVLDTASPTLNLWAARSDTISGVTLTLRQIGGSQVEFLRIELTGARITGVALTGETAGADSKPTERVSFTFEKIIWTYTPIQPGGGAGTPITHEWNTVSNTGG